MQDKGCLVCDCCGESLATSVYAVIHRELRKSCALCSRLVGSHVYHTIAEFGWHCPSREDGKPYPQSECLASWRPRTEAAILTTAPLDELRTQLADFLIVGVRCSTLGEHPRPPHNPAIAEYLEPMREEAADALAINKPRTEKKIRPPEKRCGNPCGTHVNYDPTRAPRNYDQSECYRVGERVVHPTFGVCLVGEIQRTSIAVITPIGPKILAHGRTIEVRQDLIELVRDWCAPLSVDEVATYCEIEIDDAMRQLNALVRAGRVTRVGVCQYTHSKEYQAA